MSEDEHNAEATSKANPQAEPQAAAEPNTFGDGATPAGSSDSSEARIAELERLLAVERDAATDYMQKWQRAVADFTNYKRRAQQEQEQHDQLYAAQALAPVLHALDSFERAFATLPDSLRGYTWIEGVALVDYQLRRALETQGISEVAAEPGQPFDPARHQAVGEVETDQYPAGHIAVVIQRGYQTASLLVRPALVQVARTPAVSEASAASEESGAESGKAEGATMSEAPEETQPSGPAP